MHGVQPKRKGKPHQIGAPQADRLRPSPCTLFAHQQRDRRQPQKVQAHNDDDDARDDGELARIGAQQRTDDAGAGAQRHEDRGESEHEQQRRRHGFAANPRLGLGIGKAAPSEVPVI